MKLQKAFTSDVVLVAASLIALLAFFCFKVIAFERLHYHGDIFNFLQIAQGFADGYPLLYDNDAGDHKASHNLYLVPFFFPLVRLFGAHGLFIVHLLFYLAALSLFYFLVRRGQNRPLLWSVWFIFFIGPIGFWLWDDLPYAFHAQLLFVPLCFAMAIGFLADRRILSISCALLLLLHEQGAILGWAVHFTAVFVRSGFNQQRTPWRRIGFLTAGWLVVFAGGLLLQTFFQQGDAGRLSSSVARLRVIVEPPVRDLLLTSIVDCLYLLGSGSILLLAMGNRRALAAAAVVILVLFVPGAIAAMPYTAWLPELRNHAFTWPPRFGVMWGYLAAATLITAWYAGWGSPLRFRRSIVVALVLISAVLQFYALQWRRGFWVFVRVGDVVVRTPDRVDGAERSFLECLASNIPPRSEVRTPAYLFSLFHHHYVWREHRPTQPMPDLVVVDLLGRSSFDGTEPGRLQSILEDSGYRPQRQGSIVIGASEEARRAASGCFARSSPVPQQPLSRVD